MNLRSIIIICLIAATLIPDALADGLSITNNQAICEYTENAGVVGESNGWRLSIEAEGIQTQYNIINADPTSGQQITNTVTASIASVPCGATVTCNYDLLYDGYASRVISTNLTRECSKPNYNTTGNFSNIPIGNNTNLSGPNFGTIPYNISGNITSTKILGLSKNLFFEAVAVLILTIVLLSIRPIFLSLIIFFFTLFILTEVLHLIVVSGTVIVLILLIVLITVFREGVL